MIATITAAAKMPVKLKTKTVIDAMQSLRLIPSFTTQFSGDVLPEAILLKNIMEEMLYSIETLANLETFFLGLKPRDGQGYFFDTHRVFPRLPLYVTKPVKLSIIFLE